MRQEEYEIEDGKTDAQKIVDHFMSSDLKEDDLKTYLDLKTELEALETLVEQKRKDILEKCRGMESAKAGSYVAFFKSVKGRETIDWKRFVADQIGNPPATELAPYTKKSEDSIRMEVKRL